jgi:glucarate dehydratase
VHKLKGGVFDPDYELECYRALADATDGDLLRYDPNAALSVAEARRFGMAIRDLPNDYYEDPTWGLGGLRQLRDLGLELATNTVVVNFEQLAANTLDRAADVILLDTTFWGGLRQAWKAGVVCEKFQLGVAVHSSGELGIQLATMLQLGAALPNLSFAADAHYHHLSDDIIAGGKMKYANGCIAVPSGPGLGVSLDRDKVAQYAELYRKLGNYPYDRDPARPGWFAITPERRWATPGEG